MTGKIYSAYTDDGLPFLIGEAGLAAYGPDILTRPHLVKLPPRPEPEPLSEEELAAIEWESSVLCPIPESSVREWQVVALHVPALIAEIRRLRVELAIALDRAELDRRYETLASDEHWLED